MSTSLLVYPRLTPTAYSIRINLLPPAYILSDNQTIFRTRRPNPRQRSKNYSSFNLPSCEYACMKHKLASSVGSAFLYSQVQKVQAQVTNGCGTSQSALAIERFGALRTRV